MHPTRSVRLAIADEHVLFRKGLSCLITSFNVFRTVVEVSSGPELIEKLEGRSIMPDICILSVTFPVLQVHRTIRQIKKKWPGVKILLVTSYYNRSNIGMFLISDVDGLITRSCSPSELKLALLTISDGGRYMEESLTVPQEAPPAPTEGKRRRKKHLTTRQIQFLSFCMTEMSYREIAKEMGISERTIDGYRETLFRNLKVSTRTGLIMFAVTSGVEMQTIRAPKVSEPDTTDEE